MLSRTSRREERSSSVTSPLSAEPRPGHGSRGGCVAATAEPRGRETSGGNGRTDGRNNLRGFAADFDGTDAHWLWTQYSHRPEEAGIAGRRFRMYADRLPHLPLLYAIAEAACEGHHAAGSLIEPYLRSRAARIAETLREMGKAEQQSSVPHERGSGMRSVGDVLRAASNIGRELACVEPGCSGISRGSTGRCPAHLGLRANRE